MLLNKDRLSHWLGGAVLGWAVYFLILFLPLFHWLLGYSIAKIAISAGIGCAGHLAVTPWLFSARATPQNPTGKIAQRAAALTVFFSSTVLLFFYYIQRSWPRNAESNEFRACLFGATIVAGMVGLISIGVISRRRMNVSAGS